MNNTNGLTLKAFLALCEAPRTTREEVVDARKKRADIIRGFGPAIELRGGNYTINPKGYLFACGAECDTDVGY